MSGRGRAAGALALAVLALPSAARAADWRATFAAESDTVAFIGTGGELFKAPFHLAERETLWSPEGPERISRFLVSPDGRHVAWLTRIGDQGLTWLWSSLAPGLHRLVGFLPFQPRRRGVLRYEPAIPTNQDAHARGGRLIEPNATMRRLSINALEWGVDGASLAFGFDQGLAVTRADSGAAREISPARILSLTLLDPAPFYLAEVVIPSFDAAREPEGGAEFDPLQRPEPGAASGSTARWHLVYPTFPEWKLFEASTLDGRDAWTADATTVWWADGKTIRAVRAHDPKPRVEVNAGAPVVWVGHDPSRDAIAWVAGRDVSRRPIGGGEPARVIRLHADCRRVLSGARGRRHALVAGDSLILWNPADDSRQSLGLGGVDPSAVIESSSGALLVAGSTARASTALLYRADVASRRLVPLDLPKLKNGSLVATPSGERALWFRPDPKPPETLYVVDVATGASSPVDNPGVVAWEVLRPR